MSDKRKRTGLRKVSEAGVSRTTALKFVVLLGVVSLFADMTYEGARSITGPYLGLLGASGTIIGVVARLRRADRLRPPISLGLHC